ncbi:MAG: hypothetical protein JXQ99_14720 [Hyphomicrobiaceae bacterium]
MASATGVAAQTGQVTIPANDVARIVNGMLTDARLTLHNRGDWNGNNYYNANGSSLRMMGNTRTLPVPPIHKTILQTKYMYYVNDTRSEAIVFQRENGGYILKIPFESGSTEIKGLCRKRRGLGSKRHWGECRKWRGNDQPAPDAHINNLLVKMPLQLFVRNNGIAMRIPNCDAISVRAKVEVNGVLGWGDNNRIERYAHREIRDGVRDGLCAQLNSSSVQNQMATSTAAALANLNSTLRGAASFNVSRVNSNGSIVVSYTTPLSLSDIERALRNLKMSRSPIPSGQKVARCGGKLAYTVRFRPKVAGWLDFTVEGADGKKHATWRNNVQAGKLISMNLQRPVNIANGKLRSINGKPAIETKTRVKFAFKVAGKTVSGTIPWVKKTLTCGLKRIAKVKLDHKVLSRNAKTYKGKANVATTLRSAYAGKLYYQFEGENGALTKKLSKTIKPNRLVRLKVTRSLGGPKSKKVDRNGKRIVRGKSRMHWAVKAHGQTFKGVTPWDGYRMAFPLNPQGASGLSSSGEVAPTAPAKAGKKQVRPAKTKGKNRRLRNRRTNRVRANNRHVSPAR